MKFTTTFLFFLLLTFAFPAVAQTLSDSFDQEVAYRKTGMLILGSWAVANIGGGLAFRSAADGSTRYFHEMNAIWNGVNLAIAGFGYYGAMKLASPSSGLALLTEQTSMNKVLLFNAGLDLAYIAGGFYLIERSKNVMKNIDRLEGYGQSIIMQGSFLFAFDLAMVLVHKHVRIPENLILSLQPINDGLMMGVRWGI